MLGPKSLLDVSDIIDVQLDTSPQYRRDDVFGISERNRDNLWLWLGTPDTLNPKIDRNWEKALGIYFLSPKQLDSLFLGTWGGPKFEVHSVRTTRRSGPDGQDVRQLVVEIAQRRRGYFDPKRQKLVDAGKSPRGRGDFIFRGGATLIIDLRENRLRYIMRKRIDDDVRLNEHRELLTQHAGFAFTYLGTQGSREPFALTHRGQ
jgi:hypothetical protein